MKYRVKRHAVTQPLDPSYRLIPLTREQNAMVDTADFEWLSRWNWRANWNPHTNSYYATRVEMPERPYIAMHSEIIGSMADHVNRNTLDNRRHNLRPANYSQNGANQSLQSNNTSGFIGVSWAAKLGKWVSYITVDRHRIHLGYFADKLQAAQAYDLAALKHFGEFAHLNLYSNYSPKD